MVSHKNDKEIAVRRKISKSLERDLRLFMLLPECLQQYVLGVLYVRLFKPLEEESAPRSAGTASPCDACGQRDDCREICESLGACLGPQDRARIATVAPDIVADLYSQRHAQVRDSFKEVLLLLTGQQYAAVKLVYFAGWSTPEVANALGVTKSQVNRLLREARQKRDEHFSRQ